MWAHSFLSLSWTGCCSCSPCPVLGKVLPFKLVVQILLSGLAPACIPALISVLSIMRDTSHLPPHFFRKDFSYRLGFCQVFSILSRSLNSLVQRIGPSTTVWGWCTPAKSRLARTMNCRDASTAPKQGHSNGMVCLCYSLHSIFFCCMKEEQVVIYTWLYLEQELCTGRMQAKHENELKWTKLTKIPSSS